MHFCFLSSSQTTADCVRLTGQSAYTVEVFRPALNIFHFRSRFAAASTTPAGIAWMSKYVYRYYRLMLYNLSPRTPATLHWPLYSYPPPHLLVGYQYVVKCCNDYVFDTRAYSRIRYSEIRGRFYYALRWTVLANCTYTIDTGAYHRFIDLDNFNETLQQVQQAVLADRIVADLAALRPLRGYGHTEMDGDAAVPVDRLLHEYYKRLPRCQDDAWGLCERLRFHHADNRDVVLLGAIRNLRTAFFSFLLHSFHSADCRPLSLPCTSDWLDAFVEKFSDPSLVDHTFIRSAPTGQAIRAVISALGLPLSLPLPDTLLGGAFQLRPRENGRAVTEEMRRRRGEVIQRFVDRLPVRRRRRFRPSTSPPLEPPPTPEIRDVNEEDDFNLQFNLLDFPTNHG